MIRESSDRLRESVGKELEKGKKKERHNPTVRETIWLRSIDGLHSVVIYIDSVASDDQAYCYKHSSAIEI